MRLSLNHYLLIYLRCHNVISKQQHGFLSGRSTTSNLLETLNAWTLTLNNGKAVCIANVNFAKAFNSVFALANCYVNFNPMKYPVN